jgi:hypothetical protein
VFSVQCSGRRVQDWVERWVFSFSFSFSNRVQGAKGKWSVGKFQMADFRFQISDFRWQMADGRWSMTDGGLV